MDYKELKSFPGYLVGSDKLIVSPRGRVVKPYYRDGRKIALISANGKTYQRSYDKLVHEALGAIWKEELHAGEEWKVIVGYEDYIITSHGRVWSNKTCRWLKLHRIPNTYYYGVGMMSQCGQHNYYMVSTLVGRHFLRDYKRGLSILHYDEELPFPEINYVDNLWVGTNMNNTDDMIEKGRGKSNMFQYTGVSKSKGGATFRYSISNKGKRVTKSGFLTAFDAHQAYLSHRMETKGY